MAVASYILPRFKAIDEFGRPMVGAKLYTYQNNTTTPAPTYKDAQQTAANTNPIVLNAAGEAIIYLLTDQSYTFVLKDSSDVQVWSQNDVTGAASPAGVSAAITAAIAQHASDLADGTSTDLGAALVGGVSRVVNNIAALRLQNGVKNPRVATSGYYALRDMPGSTYFYDPTDTTSADNGGSIIVGLAGQRWKNVDVRIDVRGWGILNDGATDNTARMLALRAHVLALSAAGKRVELTWPAGQYIYSQSPNWAISGLVMRAAGEVWMIHIGSGEAMLFDGSYVEGGVRGIIVEGDFRVYPNAGSTQGILIQYCHVSDIRLTSKGAGTGFQAIFIESCVCTVFRIRASTNDGGWYNTPTMALYVSQAEPGLQTSYCLFINPVLEGSPIAAFLDGAMGNTFLGGTLEATTNIGLQLTGNAIQNKFYTIDFEENANYDVFCEGLNNEFISCDTLKRLTIAAGNGNMVFGGLHQLVEVLAPADRTLLSSFKYNRVSGTAYPTDAGTRTRFRDLTNIGTGRQHNAPPTVTQLTVGPSPYNYTNNTGNDVSIHVIPGTMTGVSIVRAGQFLPASTSYGNYHLSPGDGIQIEYSAVPAVFLMPR